MTINQIMVLLDIHRGTFCPKRHLATVEDDVIRLKQEGLIILMFDFSFNPLPLKHTVPWEITEKGAEVVNNIKAASEVP